MALSTIDSTGLTAAGVTPTSLSQPLTLRTAVASTSGTSIDFTSIPSWVKRITVLFNGVSLSGTSLVQVQIGAGSVTTTGYLSYACYVINPPGNNNSTTGFLVDNASGASNLKYGTATICLVGSNAWVFSSATGNSGSSATGISGGALTLSGTLDRVRITTVNGTDTFDAGSINILYEG